MRRDEEAGDDEEDVNAHEAPGEANESGVVAEDKQHRESAHALDIAAESALGAALRLIRRSGDGYLVISCHLVHLGLSP